MTLTKSISRLAYPLQLIRQFNSLTGRMAGGAKASSDWNASLYMKFGDERTRPARDLLAQVSLASPKRIVDLGCGPGNSTELLAARYPTSRLTGIDSSPNMLEKARAALPNIEFELGDLVSYDPGEQVDLFYSNAVLQWLPKDQRIPVIQRLVQSQTSGGVVALQVPDNFDEPSHMAMRETAADGPWASALENMLAGRGSFPSPQELYNSLQPFCSKVDIWHTYYYHRLENHEAIVEWVKSTGLRPFLGPLGDGQRQAFLEQYLERLRGYYPVSVDGGVLFKFPRLFVILVRG